MRKSWNIHLAAFAAAFSLACSPPVPVSERNVARGTASPSSSETAPEPLFAVIDPIEIGPLPFPGFDTLFRQKGADTFPQEIFTGDFEPYIPTRQAALPRVLDALGELTGRYEVSVTRIADDCSWGPDVPFERNRGWWLGLEGSEVVEFPFSQTYYTTLVQRGDAVGFELGEGIVFAGSADGRVVDVERIGAEGVTFYADGFSVGLAGEGDDRLLISGESDWEFHDDYEAPGEVCSGRTYWEMLRIAEGPTAASGDLHFSLRWSAESSADLDLLIGSPTSSYATERSKNYLGEVGGNCFVLRSAGFAVAQEGDLQPSSFVAELSETVLPFHEEIISCSDAPYGDFSVEVVNWNSTDEVPYEIGAYRGASAEETLGYTSGTVLPLTRDIKSFRLVPPSPVGSGYGAEVTINVVSRQPAVRQADFVSQTFLGFNKAAYEGFSYEEFIAALGADSFG